METEPKVWNPPAKIDEIFVHLKGNNFAAVNSATSGARSQRDLPVGNAKVNLESQNPVVFIFQLAEEFRMNTVLF